ncbi:MAG: hypothetical protein R3F48_09985 [Candidatus Zixiibacteriota bacterium]
MKTVLTFVLRLSAILSIFVGLAAGQGSDYCGDANGDRNVNIGDAVYLINYIFKGGPEPLGNCCDECLDGETRPCYTGPSGTEGVGECNAGMQSCLNGVWGPCIGEITPVDELCDGLDNDCDDLIDDNLTPPPCELNNGVCSGAYKTCGGDMGWLPCQASDYGPNYELEETRCDGLDNDCDGEYDEMCSAPHVTSYDCDADTCTIAVCNAGWADCNGTFSDGCEYDLSTSVNTCTNPHMWGSFPGDEGPSCGGTDFTISNHGEYVYRFYMYEDCSNPLDPHDVGIRATLTVPAGTDYDLYLYESSCSTLRDQSTNGGNTTEYVDYYNEDTFGGGTDESRYYNVEIRFYSGTSCANWTLRIQSWAE